jgi:hypothetical protein
MDGACGTYGRENTYIVLVGNERERYNLEDLAVDGKIILNWSSRNRMGIHLDRDRDKYVAVVNMAMNLRVP